MAVLHSFVQLLVLLCFFGRSTGIPFERNPPALPPSQDPWYTAPEGFEQTDPGTVLRIRPGNDSLLPALGTNLSSVWTVLYRTTDSFDKPSWAVTTLLVPSKPLLANGTRLLSYQIPYNTNNVDYSPSYTLESQFASAFSDLTPALSRGWYVNIPDFEGPRAAFSVSVEAAHATLDSIRAVINVDRGLTQQTRVALWGYSGGSMPSEFSAEIAPYYAPEIDLVGVAIGGLVTNVTNALDVVDGTFYAGLNMLAILGVSARYPEVEAYLDTTLKSDGPYNKTSFLSAGKMATFEAFSFFANQSVSDYFSNGEAYLDAPQLRPARERNWQMGAYFTPRAPLYVYKAIQDELSPVGDTDVLVDNYCTDGANILYERNTVGSHQDEYVYGSASAYAWLVSVLEGRYAKVYNPVGCTIRDVTVSVPL
ncbi:hypothetical protein ASPVEDRAFT_326696 [Aspergillus versicolor CBS 583.65]|uniref:Secretory lipase-domain-containing protein n=1 Tax=Aspergillus versicolor CBS 583.65 TaxID=1036611 RepID=A0A1L9PYC2_ASPVE|nr:uncharacterized protein ASPVEDRAFT_326696 [Aspergillus versicolor CBS 583.65]OJJ06463.1 hypothetical protein ASPVEDRAFT_326696 [Aspergillus versicolor CBS 583.65]